MASQPKINIWLVEDNVTYRETVGRLLKRADPQWEIGFFANCEIAFDALARQTPPDVMLLDIRLPGVSGVEGIVKFRQLAPSAHIVMLTSSENQDEIRSVIRHGASGYLLKSSAPDRVVDAVREVMAGGAPLTPKVASTILSQLREKNSLGAAAATFRLNGREQQALILLVEGLATKEIAERMSISYHTVDFHLRNIYAKLEVQSRSAAVAKAVRENLVAG
jgi:DNA-binding NarL/FixJ family response regulator